VRMSASARKALAAPAPCASAAIVPTGCVEWPVA
jgi:hypothetical protein